MSDIYDKAFRTALNDCPKFLLPFLNEVFGEKYTGNEEIEFHPNEHFINQNEETEQKRITDTNFTVYGAVKKEYHLECESSRYSAKLLVRIFEYDAQIALDHSTMKGNSIKVSFPNTAVLCLRSTKKTPDKMNIIIDVPGDSARYDVPVVMMKDYTAEDIFRKKLYLLIPFYIFNYEKKLSKCDRNDEEYNTLQNEFRYISDELKRLTENEEITSYDKRIMEELSKCVIDSFAVKFEKIKKGIGDIMCGPVIETEADKLLNKGFEKGIATGMATGITTGIATAVKVINMLKKNQPDDVIIEHTGITKEKLDEIKAQLESEN